MSDNPVIAFGTPYAHPNLKTFSIVSCSFQPALSLTSSAAQTRRNRDNMTFIDLQELQTELNKTKGTLDNWAARMGHAADDCKQSHKQNIKAYGGAAYILPGTLEDPSSCVLPC